MRRVACVTAAVAAGVFWQPAVLAAVPPAGVAPVASVAAAAEPCADVLLVGVPGAGERVQPGGAPGTDGLGPTLEVVSDGFVDTAVDLGRTVAVAGIDLDAAPPSSLAPGAGASRPASEVVSRPRQVREWRGRLRPVSGQLLRTLEEQAAACPQQLVALAGYSQGAMAVHVALLRLAERPHLVDRVVGAVLVSDGYRTAGTRARLDGAPSAPATGQGVAPHAGVVRDDVPHPSASVGVRSVCTRGDVVCDVRRTPWRDALRAARAYTTGESAEAVDRSARRVAGRLDRWPLPEPVTEVAGQVGVALSRQLEAVVDPSASLRWKALEELPPGLQLGSDGLLEGVPAAAGSWAVDYQVRNADPAYGLPARGVLELVVDPPSSVQVSAGGRHTCSVTADRTLWCWGRNDHGQLGDGTRTARTSPVQVGSRAGWLAVSAGGSSTCATRSGGALFCWGLNHRGQLGLDDRRDRLVPRRVGDRTDWAQVSVGWEHACAVASDGTAWCWGDGGAGKLGTGRDRDAWTPSRVPGDAWASVTAGGRHTCGVTTGGAARCWGGNADGQLGDGTRRSRTGPVGVDGPSGWTQLSASWSHTCGVRTGGELRCWGLGLDGQLGSGTRGAAVRPTAVAGDHEWASVGTGVASSCGTTVHGRVLCWGGNRYGQLGDGTATPRAVPGATSSGTGHTGLDVGWLHACAVDASAKRRCWGLNEDGQLGDGSHLDTADRAGAVPPSGGKSGDGPAFHLTTFNVLGSNHTDPRRHDDEWTPARVRAEWSATLLERLGAEVIGLHEVQRDQLSWLMRATAGRYDVFPGNSLGWNGVQSSLLWDSSRFEAVETDHVVIPFVGQRRIMPVVRFRELATDREMWVMNVHNAPEGRQAERDAATRIELDKLEELQATGLPVFVIGDFNERERAFCRFTGRGGLETPRGGRNDTDGCVPPAGRLRVDWIFGSRDAEWSDYTEDRRPLVRRITDHAVLHVRVRVP